MSEYIYSSKFIFQDLGSCNNIKETSYHLPRQKYLRLPKNIQFVYCFSICLIVCYQMTLSETVTHGLSPHWYNQGSDPCYEKSAILNDNIHAPATQIFSGKEKVNVSKSCRILDTGRRSSPKKEV